MKVISVCRRWKPLDRKELGRLLARWVPEERRRAKEDKEEGGKADLSAFQIEGIDIDAASRYYTGDEAGFVDLLDLYYTDGQRKTALLRELSDSDISRYCVEVHGLKSASANIGAMGVSEMARAQENAANRGDRAFIAQEFPALLRAYEALLTNIELFLEQRRQDDSQKEKLPALSLQELKKQVGEALEELEDFRSRECAQIVRDVLCHELPQDVEDSLRDIQGQLRLYEDDSAEALLNQLLRKLEKEEGGNDEAGRKQ